ncbi:MAG TPA: hypothetical protein VFJ85_09935 [Acidimicrobiales bacterium]|nr:hypothetical protein [Acidimicrobiales bacterium]
MTVRNQRSRSAPRRRAREDDGGFTLIELAVAVGMAGFVFAALAAVLGQSLKVLAVSKSRSHGNEIATQGIEDLQRLAYPALGVCSPATSPPEGFSSPAAPLNCPAPVPAGYGDDPCNVTTAGAGIPKSSYTCTELNIAYNVRRYVAWGDPGHTTKRMAVFVNWTDAMGRHEVSQQSSLRAPGQADIYGLDPPQFTAPVSVSPSTVITNADGTLPSGTTVLVQATTLNLATGDRVFAVFNTIDTDGNSITSSKALTSTDGNNWSTSISNSDGFQFPPGTLFFSVSAIRNDDGKANAAFASSANKFCSPPDTTCSSGSYPAFSSVDAQPSANGPNILVDSGGTLVPGSIDLTASTTNTTSADTVSVAFQTSAGTVTVLLQSTSPGCDASSTCTWSGSVTQSAGYGFATGTRKFYFTVSSATSGSTGALASSDKVFQLQ